MNIKEYQQNVLRTMPDLGSLLLNSIHMTLGIGTEITEELVLALDKKDKVNVSEELADAQWYICNYATLYNIEIADVKKNEPEIELGLFVLVGRIQDYDKKELAYGKQTTLKERKKTLRTLLSAVEYIADVNQIDMDEARQKVINKLMLRFPDKFDSEKAINRDVVAERTILEAE